MKPQNLTQAVNQLAGPQPLYSARAIRYFSMLFSAIAGGFLTAQNLRDVGEAGAARKALWGSIGYTVAVMGIASLLPDRFTGHSWLAVVTGLAGATGLEAYAKKFLPHWAEAPTKSIVKPLLICLAIFVPLIALLIYGMLAAQPQPR